MQRRFAFVFPMASGHINPSLPIARALVRQGHEVHYQCRNQMREAIEHTGARFHDEIQNCTEMYDGREPSLFNALESLKKEFGLEDDAMLVSYKKLGPIIMELMVPGTLRFLQRVNADVVVCCPLMNKDAVYAAKFLKIPCVGLLTTAGPGSMKKAFEEMLRVSGITSEEVLQSATHFVPGHESSRRLEANYGIKLRPADGFEPIGVLDSIRDSTLTLVTTCQDLQDPTSPELDEAYAGTVFEAVGPLLDEQGAVRAAGHKFGTHEPATGHDSVQAKVGEDCPLACLHAARAAGRKVVLVSMGTVITGDSEDWGWDAKPRVGADGVRQGLTGQELCQAAWGGAFDAFGASGAAAGAAPLLLVALGPQEGALGDLQVPDNALCMPVLPQVDILKAGVDLFLTHGGQNSFTEALSQGVPLVVCPGFADQPVNARKAVDLGVGLQVERPVPTVGQESQAAWTYRNSVCAALQEVFSERRFAVAASGCCERLQAAGGVPRAVKVILDLAGGANVIDNGAKFPILLATATVQTYADDKRGCSGKTHGGVGVY